MDKNSITNNCTMNTSASSQDQAQCVLKDDNYELLLSKISTIGKKSTEIQKSIFKDEETKILHSSCLDCLKTTSDIFDDVFVLHSEYEMIVSQWTNPSTLTRIRSQLEAASIYQKNKNYNISPKDDIGKMVEATYLYDNQKQFQMAEEICYMRMLAKKWRPIGGDGNCFYRSVMYAYLENLILERKVVTLQKILVEIVTKYNNDYPNTSILNKEVREPIISLDRRLITTILKIIIDTLDSSEDKSIQSALIFLCKAFNYSKSFDSAMIIYLRYKLYEFIKDNSEKYFSQDFPVKIGNLLPFQYETEDGKFLYQNFFNEELLKLYTYAEKIAIYLTPFVLKINLRVIFYEFGDDCNIQTKDFCYQPQDNTSKISQINILYRKAHYDLAYSEELSNSFMDYFDSCDQSLKIVDEALIQYFQLNEIKKVDLAQSKIFSKKEPEAKGEMSTKEDELEELIKLKENYEKEYQQLLKKENCSFCYNKTETLILRFPCGCTSYHQECFNKIMKEFVRIEKNKKCLNCHKPISMKEMMQTIQDLEVNKLSGSGENYKDLLINNFKKTCMICWTQPSKEKSKIKVYKDEIFKAKLNTKYIDHLVCEECEKIRSNVCRICESHHLHVLNK